MIISEVWRRLDVIETAAIAKALGTTLANVVRRLDQQPNDP